jgi:hypothetical protein
VIEVARKRQARKCSARRTDGKPCGAYAMIGGYVCRSHGGAAPAVRHAAYVRQTEAELHRQFEHEYGRWVREWRKWQARRIAIAAVRLNIPVAEVEPFLIGVCQSMYGEPDGPETEPRMRRDRRFGPRKPWRGGRRPPLVIGD